MPEAALGQQIINGLTLGCLYALIALGYTIIFGVMRLIFFAQGDLCMVGAFAALGILGMLGQSGYGWHWWSIPVALAVAAAAAVGAGLLAERLTVRPLRRAERTKQLIASLGVSMILQNLCLLLVSTENLPFPRLLPETTWQAGGMLIAPVQVFVIGFSLLLMLALQLLLRAPLGLRLRAVAENAATAELDGINVTNAVRLTFVIGSVLAGIAGVMMGAYDGVAKYNMGFLPGIKGFTAAILGGFGQPAGAMLGGLMLGIVETLAAGYISSTYKDVIAFALLVLVLVVRPRGLVGSRE